jgi:hypothetical protein
MGSAMAADCQYQFRGIVRIDKKLGYFLVMNEKSKSEIKFKIASPAVFNFSVYLNRYVSGKTRLNHLREAYEPLDLKRDIPDPLQTASRENFKKISTDKCEN